MKSRGLIGIGFALLAVVVLLVSAATSTQAAQAPDPGVARGAALYDKWYAVVGTAAPQGNMPIWASQKTNTRSGEDTWRCVSCHGWDYQGKDGAYRAGANYTGFPGVYQAAQKSTDEIVAALKGKTNPDHDFSKYLDDASLTDLAKFIQSGTPDDNRYIDLVALTVKGGDKAHGKELYDGQCAKCHDADGTKIKFRLDGREATLGTIAAVDPWRLLHKTRFGTPGTEMVVGYNLSWTAQDGRDILLYAQSLPSGLTSTHTPPTVGDNPNTGDVPAGQSQSIFIGLATALGAIVTSLGFALVLGAFLIGVIFVVVWSLRDRKK
jgi:mono/diheme cytochrome c family protein